MKNGRISAQDIYLIAVIALVAFIAFNLGKITTYKAQNEPLRLDHAQEWEILRPAAEHTEKNTVKPEVAGEQTTNTGSNIDVDFPVVISKKSRSGVYHFEWCSGAKLIKEENAVWFTTEQEAIDAGYTLAGNCNK